MHAKMDRCRLNWEDYKTALELSFGDPERERKSVLKFLEDYKQRPEAGARAYKKRLDELCRLAGWLQDPSKVLYDIYWEGLREGTRSRILPFSGTANRFALIYEFIEKATQAERPLCQP